MKLKKDIMKKNILQSESFRKLNIFMIEYLIFYSNIIAALLISYIAVKKSFSHGIIFFAILFSVILYLRKGLSKTSYIAALRIVK